MGGTLKACDFTILKYKIKFENGNLKSNFRIENQNTNWNLKIEFGIENGN